MIDDIQMTYVVVRISDGTPVHARAFRNAAEAARVLLPGTTFGLGLTFDWALQAARRAAARVREFRPDYR